MIRMFAQNKSARLYFARVCLLAGALFLLGCFPHTDWDLRVDPYGRSKSSGMSAANSSESSAFSGSENGASGDSSGGVSSGGSSGGTSSGSSGNGGALDTIAAVSAFLASQTGGATIADPINLVLDLDLSNMTQTGGDWVPLMDVLAAANKYVTLDLSDCTIDGTIFAYDSGAAAGQGKVVSLILPDAATTIIQGGTTPQSFITALKTFSGANLTSIGNYAFQGCTGLALAELPPGITSIGLAAFYDCTSLALTELPVSITSIGNSAFHGCTGLALTELPPGITSIGDAAFDVCTGLALTELPDGVTSIGYAAFSNCTSFVQMSLPAGITDIGNYAFASCSNLATVICNAVTPPTLGSNAFIGCHANLEIRVPAGSVAVYQVAAGWSDYASKIVAIP
jgi:hypothetical protein